LPRVRAIGRHSGRRFYFSWYEKCRKRLRSVEIAERRVQLDYAYEPETIKEATMDKRILKPLAKRLKCAYLSYHLDVSLAYCMKRYVDDYEIEEYWHEIADIIWSDNHRQPKQLFRVYTFHDWANLGGGLGPLLVRERDAFITAFGRLPTPDDPFFFDPTKPYPVSIPHEELLNELIASGEKDAQTREESLRLFYQIFRFPIEGPQTQKDPPEET
jgi:hypothetical protein